MNIKGVYLHFNVQDGASLVRAIVSKEGIIFRRLFCKVVSDVLYQWMVQTHGQGAMTSDFGSHGNLDRGPESKEPIPPCGPSISLYDCQSILRDRRLKVVFLRILGSARKDPVLMLKFCLTSLVMFVMATAMACYRVLVSLSKSYIGHLSLAPKRVAVSV
uniref:Uncharacterized protein MANES_07G104400 n=1 Tax=Rhizophora mucronata TaxID=61149 RepID=A0A2P2M2B9_RHIMU